MKNLYSYSLIFALLAISNGKWLTTNDNNEIQSISGGSMLGKCRGYCRRSINITSIPLQVIALKEPNYEQIEYPPVQRLYPFSSTEWQELVTLIDSEKFQSLADHIECTSECYADWVQWIQIDWINESKQITFNGQTVPGFESLVDKLNQMQEQYQVES